MICVHDFPRAEVSVKVGVTLEFGLYRYMALGYLCQSSLQVTKCGIHSNTEFGEIWNLFFFVSNLNLTLHLDI